LNSFLNISNLIQLSKLNKINNTLLVPIKVKDMVAMGKYNIEIGNKKITTKSLIELEEWTKYWGELVNNTDGNIKISNIKKKPQLLQEDTFPLAFDLDNLSKIFQLPEPINYIKSVYLSSLEECRNEKDFLFLSNLLLSIHFDVVSIPFIYKNEYHMLQIKFNQKNTEFVMSSNHLGMIYGNIDDSKNSVLLMFFIEANIKTLSKNIKKKINSIEINVRHSKKINFFFEFKKNALNIKI